jgi:hypothetical protein
MRCFEPLGQPPKRQSTARLPRPAGGRDLLWLRHNRLSLFRPPASSSAARRGNEWSRPPARFQSTPVP